MKDALRGLLIGTPARLPLDFVLLIVFAAAGISVPKQKLSCHFQPVPLKPDPVDRAT